MDYDEHVKLSGEISDIAWNSFYKTDVLKGYCENSMPDKIPSTMLFTLLEEILDNSSKLIKLTDVYSTNVVKIFLK